jgi:hypothetical protein
MKAPKKPKLKSLPKRPKSSASLSTWENFKKKCDEVRKANAKALADWKKAVSNIKAESKKKESIQKATQGLGRI